MVRLTAHYNGKVIVPDEPVQLPEGVPLEITVRPQNHSGQSDPILELSGLGMDVWAGVDPVEYQRREREGWE